MAEEYYIRQSDSETARGPFDIDKMLTLVDADQITPETLFYDDEMEVWMPIGASAEMKAKIFPDKKKLILRGKGKEDFASLNDRGEDEGASMTVEEMLAAAEGESEETEHLKDKQRWENRAANISVPALGAILLISALSYIYPSWDMITGFIDGEQGAVQRLFLRPLVFLGAFDLLMSIILFLNVTEIFPMIRFRAMFGMGYFGVVYWASYLNGDPSALWMALAVIAYGIGLFIVTLTLNFRLMVSSAAVGLAGVLGFAWFTNIQPLLSSFE